MWVMCPALRPRGLIVSSTQLLFYMESNNLLEVIEEEVQNLSWLCGQSEAVAAPTTWACMSSESRQS